MGKASTAIKEIPVTPPIKVEPAADGLMRLPELLRVTGVHSVTVWRMQKAGTFPKCVHLGRRAIAWRRSEIAEWLKNLK